MLVDAQRDIAERGRGDDRPAARRSWSTRSKLTAAERDADRWRASQPTDLLRRRPGGGRLRRSRRRPRTRDSSSRSSRRSTRPAGAARSWRRTPRRSPSPRSAPRSRRPERVIGMHFMNPAPLMKLVEIIRGLPTADATYETTRALAERLGKTTVAVARHPGLHRQPRADPAAQRGLLRALRGLGTVEDIDTGVHARPQPPDGAARARWI